MVRLPFVAWLSESDLMILFLLALVGVGGDARAICRPKAQLRAENPPPPPASAQTSTASGKQRSELDARLGAPPPPCHLAAAGSTRRDRTATNRRPERAVNWSCAIERLPH